MTGLDLLEKTELWVEDILLRDVDLTQLAKCAGQVLGLGAQDIFVTDVRDGRVVFDVVSPSVSLDAIAGKEAQLLAALAAFPGVQLGRAASVHSHGVLGVIGAPAEQAADIIANAARLESSLQAYVSRAVVVLSTGGEVARGEIEDTNYAAVKSVLGDMGYLVHHAGVVEDDEALIAARIGHLLGEGYGLLITTGGVGAEDKDKTIEAMQRLAPDLSTAILAQYAVGHGRHVKPHVRVACGRVGETLLVALPGPTREVLAALPELAIAMGQGQSPSVIAEAVAAPIRALWKAHKVGHSHS
ncbi:MULTISPECIES: molybdopterin-binding protein [Blastomonas]|uniref:molybdopterin-binding protein n=1 Tax=Blastomonas TaxID=150203 RepID=UPI00083D9F26|nr:MULTISPECIES: molybdopterin-binding protein [Blastomonas]AOG01070.1 putative molybdopterin binding domain protein [Blastomonas sp. RAC04]MDM7928549.1 molybdopterin-binding protein [Blastomonas fulva]MDM7966642.1 molybdopterin-binding protein [Blastomonas fulva]